MIRVARAKKRGGRGKTRSGGRGAHEWVLCFGAAALLGLALYGGDAGAIGAEVSRFTRSALGLGAYLLPPLVAALPVWRGRMKAWVLGGLGLVSLLGILSLRPGAPAYRGGAVGRTLVLPLLAALGRWAAGVLLGTLLLLAAVGLFGEGTLARLCGLARVTVGRVSRSGRALLRRAGGIAASLLARGRRVSSTAESSGEERQEGGSPPPPDSLKVAALEAFREEGAEAPGMRQEETERTEGSTLFLERSGVPPSTEMGYSLPPLELLRRTPGRPRGPRGSDEVIRVLEQTLKDFGVDAVVTGVTRGPTVSQYEIQLGPGVKVQKIRSLTDDISYALGSPDVRIITPVPGRPAIGVQVPNKDRDLVALGDVLSSPDARAETHPLSVGLGKDISGKPMVVNLGSLPHLLIGGATGSGKSSCIHAVVTSLLMRATPLQVRLLLVDPKRVELFHYNGVPHLLAPVITHPKRAAEALGWVVREMERRYEVLALAGARSLDAYNAGLSAQLSLVEASGDGGPMPYIVVVIDELADLMMVAPREVEESISRIAQMARAVGIHLVVATQRPSVDVVTGLIKANIPARLAFHTSSGTDSRVILDTYGAEKLVGHGDGLFLPVGVSRPVRMQAAFVSEKEIQAVVEWWRKEASPSYVPEATPWGEEEACEEPEGSDPLLQEAMELVVRTGIGSTSLIQRRLRVGFARAGRIMDLLEERGVVGPAQGSRPRQVLITPEQLEQMKARRSR